MLLDFVRSEINDCIVLVILICKAEIWECDYVIKMYLAYHADKDILT